MRNGSISDLGVCTTLGAACMMPLLVNGVAAVATGYYDWAMFFGVSAFASLLLGTTLDAQPWNTGRWDFD